MNGLCDPNGSGVLSTLASFQDLCSFLRKLCISLSPTSTLQEVQYEICRVKIGVSKKRKKTSLDLDTDVDNDLNITHSVSGKTCEHAFDIVNSESSLNTEKTENDFTLKDVTDARIDKVVQNFQKKVCHGPCYICSCCTQTWFRENVHKATSLIGSSDLLQNCLLGIKSVENTEWVCNTCYRNLKSQKIPSCSVFNGMGFPEKPPELDITELEERLISPRIPFMQVVEKPRGGQKSLRGNVVNVPSDVNSTVTSLPRTLSDSETVQVKLKRKMNFKHSVLHEAIRPNKCLKALKWLLKNSSLFQTEGIKMNENWNIESEMHEWLGYDVGNSESDSHIETLSSETELTNQNNANHDDDSDEWTEDPNFENRLTGSTDTLLHPVDVRSLCKTFSFAPGEGQVPLGLYQDNNAEYLAFPSIYCGQKRPENKDRQMPVHYSTICKWELRSVDRRAACSVPNIFFKLKKLQIKQIQDRVNLAMRKCQLNGQKVTVGQVLNQSTFDNIVRLDEGYRVLRQLRGSPAYWESAKRDVFAMIRQLGVPTWFCSLSAAETRWPSLLKILGQQVKHVEYTDEEIANLTWKEKCELVQSDPVTCTRFFNHRVQVFISDVLKSSNFPLGRVVDHFHRVEFQQRGSPHIHMLVWIENAPLYAKSDKQDLENFIDTHSSCQKRNDIPDLINYQTHRHARTCRKKGKNICRFNFPLPPMSRTQILEPLQDAEKEKYPKIVDEYERIASLLNEMKTGFDMSFSEFLCKLEISEEMYIMALRSSLKSPKVFLKRDVSEIRVNSYNEMILKCWQANIDVQFILDAYACAAYIVSYISKSQRGMSNLMYEACKEARQGNKTLKQQVRHIGNKFLTHVEVSAQEAAYLILQLPLRVSTRSFAFINTNHDENRTFLLKPLDVLSELPESSTDIQSDNALKRYQRRPNALKNICLADFVSQFDVISEKKNEGNQNKDGDLPEDERNEEDEDMLAEQDETVDSLQMEYHMRNGTILRKRKTNKIIRYVRFNKDQDPENFYREQLMLFYPWRNETKDLQGNYGTYEEHYKRKVEIINANKLKYEVDEGIIDIVEKNMTDCDEEFHVIAAEVQHNEEVDQYEKTDDENIFHGCFNPKDIGLDYDIGLDLGITRKQISICDTPVNSLSHNDYMNLVRTLNEKQKIFFYHVLHKMKMNEGPIYCFLTGGAGVGKSIVTTAIYQAVTRYFAKKIHENPDDVKTLLCAPTGKAAYNIGGQTIHSLFCIPANQSLKYKPLDMKQLDSFRVKFRSLKVIFIDEISMVGNKLFNYINLRLQEIFATEKPFGGVSIIAIGDLFQLKPVFDGWIFQNLVDDYGPLAANLWQDHFRVFELTDIMRQKDDKSFAELLNRMRKGLHSSADIATLKTRLKSLDSIPSSLPYLYTINAQVDEHNMLAYTNAETSKKCTISAIDTVSGDVTKDIKQKILSKVSDDPSKTMGLFKNLLIVEDMPAEICINIDVEDGLTNGTTCLVKKLDFRVENSQRCSIIWVAFENEAVGSKARTKYAHLFAPYCSKSWTPVLEITRNFNVGMFRSAYVIRRQFPLRLACAKTIHKSQGSTMNKAVLHFGKRKQEHMHYVGLSRVRKLEDVFLLELNESKISVSKSVADEMDRLYSEATLHSCLPLLQNLNEDLKLLYHNCRSLHLHINDMKLEKNLISADIIAIAESRLKPSDDATCYELQGYSTFRFDDEKYISGRPYHGIVIYSKIPFQNIRRLHIMATETVLCHIIHRERILQLVFFYCSPQKASQGYLCQYLQNLFELLGTEHHFVIMGDANVDFFTQTCLSEFLIDHKVSQVVHSVTSDYDSCLDHIYTNMMCPSQISSAILESYYSDHKPIVAYLPYHDDHTDELE